MPEQNAAYLQVVDGLRLVASPFRVQKSVLPEFVDLPNEIFLAVDEAGVESLSAEGVISPEARASLKEYFSYLDESPIADDYEMAMAELEVGAWYEELRSKATAILLMLGEPVSEPQLNGVSYVKGKT